MFPPPVITTSASTIARSGAVARWADVASMPKPAMAAPAAVILQHAPERHSLGDFPDVVMPSVESEINLIETFAKTKVIGLTINHEQMDAAAVSDAIRQYEEALGFPVTDALTRSPSRLVDMVTEAFPELRRKPALDAA